jgi:hypothetical protein
MARFVFTPQTTQNTSIPTLDANGYPGGAYRITDGVWIGAESFTYFIESSPTGSAPWTEFGETQGSGTWDESLAELYVRAKVVAAPGDVVAYSAPLLLGKAFDQILDFANSGNTIGHAISAPFLGQSSGDGVDFWLMAQWFYPGSGVANDSYIVGIGDLADTDTHAMMSPTTTLWRSGGANAEANIASVSPIIAGGSYISTTRFRNVSGNHFATMWCNLVSVESASAGGAVSLTNMTTMRIGAGVGVATSSPWNFPIAWVAFGKGNPAAAHAWAFNGGNQRRVDEYNFGTDPNGATLEGFVLLSRENPGNTTFSIGEVVDSVGSYDSWSLTGSLAWTNRKPGFINPAGDPPTTPDAYISPRFATTDDSTLTIGINTKNIGEALGSDFTINSLTHSVDGDISGTVTGDTFPNPGVGTITGSITVGGDTVSVTCDIFVPAALPADPQFWTRYNENALVAGIEPYPATGTGTTYASIAALKTAIDALGSGGTLTINDLSEAGTLTLTGKDYGGATLIAKNRHGVAINRINMDDVRNLTIRGFSALSGGFVGLAGNSTDGFFANGTSGITLDHCTGTGWGAVGRNGSTATFTVTNWIGPDDGSANQNIVNEFNVLTLRRVAHGNTNATTGDVNRSDRCNTIIAERVWFGDNGNTSPSAHPDCWQMYGAGTNGFLNGIILNCVFNDIITGGQFGAAGLFFETSVKCQGFRVRNVAVRSALNMSIGMSDALQNCSIENTIANGSAYIGSGSLAYSGFTSNNLKPVGTMHSVAVGPSTGTTNVAMTTAFPQWVSHAGSWEQWDNPAAGYTDKGAAALIAELAALKATL